MGSRVWRFGEVVCVWGGVFCTHLPFLAVRCAVRESAQMNTDGWRFDINVQRSVSECTPSLVALYRYMLYRCA